MGFLKQYSLLNERRLIFFLTLIIYVVQFYIDWCSDDAESDTVGTKGYLRLSNESLPIPLPLICCIGTTTLK